MRPLGITLLPIGDDPGRLVLPLRLEMAGAADCPGVMVPRFVPAHMGAYEYEHGIPDRLFEKHAASKRTFYLSEICVHGAWLNVFVSAPKRLNFEKYKLELKRLALGLTYHNRDPGIVPATKKLAGKPVPDGYQDWGFNVWFDMNNGAIFTFDVDAARYIVVGPGARLNRFPIPVIEQAQAA